MTGLANSITILVTWSLSIHICINSSLKSEEVSGQKNHRDVGWKNLDTSPKVQHT